MADRMETPTELGIPLPFVPIDDLEAVKHLTDWHHHFHPRRDPLLREEGGVVIRTARLQRAVIDGPHLEYHQQYAGPELPSTIEERFRVAVLARAGYIPEHGLLLRGQLKPRIVRLSDRQRHLLIEGGQLRAGSVGETHAFIGRLALEQDLSDINETTIDEFLHSPDLVRRRMLGLWMLSQAINRTALPIAADYTRAWTEGRIPRTLPSKTYKFLWGALKSDGRDRLVVKLGNKYEPDIAEAA